MRENLRIWECDHLKISVANQKTGKGFSKFHAG